MLPQDWAVSTPFIQHTFMYKVLGEKVILQCAPCRDDIQQSDLPFQLLIRFLIICFRARLSRDFELRLNMNEEENNDLQERTW